jgi:pilus assembly protein CpaB
MSGSRRALTLLIALILASLAAIGAYSAVSDGQRGAAVAPPNTPTALPGEKVLVATQNIAAASVLTDDMVELREVPADFVNPHALTNPDRAVGRYAAVAFVQGEQILGTRVSEMPIQTGETFARNVPVGLRAISIAYDEVIGPGALVQPGDFVDVIAYFELEVTDFTLAADGESEPSESDSTDDSADDGPDYKQYVTTYIVQNAEVLAVSQATTPDELGVEGSGPTATATTESTDSSGASSESTVEPQARPSAKSVTLAVTPEQAQRLLLAAQTVTSPKAGDQQSNASLRLVLRAPGDTTIANLPPAQLGTIPVGDLLGDVNEPMVPSDVVISAAEFTQRVLPSGTVLEFKATVKNVSDRAIKSSTEAPPEYEYTEGVAYDYLGFFPERGTYRIALNVADAYPVSFPYRWGLGRDLEPGESIEVVGSVRLTDPTPSTRYWLGIIREPDLVTQDGVSVSDITVIASETGKIASRSAELRVQPQASADVVTQLEKGAELEILEARNGWFLVRSADAEGWIQAASVTVPPLESEDERAKRRSDET